jgi:nitrile hydratase accessory protein
LSVPDLALPRDAAGAPVFPGVWQAKAFALAVLLNENGALPWPEFAAALGAECARDPGADYYVAWLRALELVLAARGLAAPQAVADLANAWQRAAAATPHGTPILLDNARH